MSLEPTTTGTSLRGDLAENAVDLGASADVDALRGLVGNEERRLGEHRPRHDDLLLVAAGERGNRRLERGRLDGELGELALHRSTSRRWLTNGPTRSRSSAVTDEFSRTFRSIIKPSVRRSAGM